MDVGLGESAFLLVLNCKRLPCASVALFTQEHSFILVPVKSNNSRIFYFIIYLFILQEFELSCDV